MDMEMDIMGGERDPLLPEEEEETNLDLDDQLETDETGLVGRNQLKNFFNEQGYDVPEERYRNIIQRPGENRSKYLSRITSEIKQIELEQKRGKKSNRLIVSTLLTKYPDLDENVIDITTDRNGKQLISFWSNRKMSWSKPERLYNEDKTIRKSANDKIKSGKYNQIPTDLLIMVNQNEEIENEIRTRDEEIGRNNEEISPTSDQDRIRTLDTRNQELENQNVADRETIEENNQEIEQIEERMSLRNRIKYIFKKYGFTVASIATAVAITIGVLVSQLKSGLSSVAKGVGNGLKTLGKKLGEILPGMIGARASFIFKTAGEVVSFVAEHAWLLIVAVVAFMIEKMKK